MRNGQVIHKQKSIGYESSAECNRIPGTLSLRYSKPAPSIIVEPTISGLFRVNVRPICSRTDLERSFAYAADALDYAELLHMDRGWPIIDETEGC